MKLVRWTSHAVDALAARQIDRAIVEATLVEPEFVARQSSTRDALMRRYFDHASGRWMLLRAIVEETATERVVVTVYKTSRLAKYLKELVE